MSSLSSIYIPKTPGEELCHPEWRQALIDEMCVLSNNGNWELVPLPYGKSLVNCHWIYTMKVKQSLYGLKQSLRYWFCIFIIVVQQFGMVCSEADHFVFYPHLDQWCIYLIVCVDDIIITGSDK